MVGALALTVASDDGSLNGAPAANDGSPVSSR